MILKHLSHGRAFRGRIITHTPVRVFNTLLPVNSKFNVLSCGLPYISDLSQLIVRLKLLLLTWRGGRHMGMREDLSVRILER
jgi:hypothetical protein